MTADAYAFDQFVLEPSRRRLTRNGGPVDITSKCLDLLIILVSRAGTTVSREDLVAAVWRKDISEATLTQHVFMLRRLLRDDAPTNEFVATIPGIGYRFVAKVAATARIDPSRLAAAQLCQDAEHFFERRNEPAVRSAIALYTRALEISPTSVDALAGLAASHMIRADYFYAAPKGELEISRDFARRALKLDAQNGMANVACAKYALDYERDFPTAALYLERGLAAAPHNPVAIFMSCWARVLQRDFANAKRFIDQELGRNRGNPLLEGLPALIALYSGDLAQAIVESRRVLESWPDSWLIKVALGQALFLTGKVKEAIAAFDETWRAEYDAFMTYQVHMRYFAAGYLIYALFRSDQSDRANEIWARIRRIEEAHFVPAMLHAIAHTGQGNFEEARQWISRSADNRECWYTHLAVEPFLYDALTQEGEMRPGA